MKNISLPVLLSFVLLLSCRVAASASDTSIIGSVYFTSSLASSYMKKHGYVYIEERFKKNIFAAEDADISIRNEDGSIVGRGKTDKQGNFSISVLDNNSYKITIRFHGRDSEYAVSSSKKNNFIAYLGFFNSNEVGNWIDAKMRMSRF